LLPFGKDVVSPGEPPIKVESKKLDVVFAGKDINGNLMDGR
jgi:hypothetical protein